MGSMSAPMDLYGQDASCLLQPAECSSPSALIQSLAAVQSNRGTSPPYIDVYLVSSDEL